MPAKPTLRLLYAAGLNSRKYPRIESVGGFWPNSRERSGGVDSSPPYKRTGQQPLIKPYVRISRIRLPSMFTVQTLNPLAEAPPGDSTAPARGGTGAHPGTRAT